MTGKKILVTGGAGFLGTHLIDLLAGTHQVYCLTKTPVSHPRDDVTYVRADLGQPLEKDRLPREVDHIVHLAAIMGKDAGNDELFRVNVAGTFGLLEYGRESGISSFIYASTGGVYGYGVSPRDERSGIAPVDFYGLSKYQSELLISHYARYFSTATMRLFYPYGPGQSRGIVPTLAGRIRDHEPVTVFNNDNPRINPVYVSDVVEAIAGSLTLRGNHTCNVAGDEVVSVRQLAELIGKRLGTEPSFRHVRDDAVGDMIGENGAMKKLLSIRPRVTIEQGLARCLDGGPGRK